MSDDLQEIEKDITTVIADDLEIHGTIKYKTSVMIKGLFEGEIFSEGLLVIGPTAKVKATITTKNMISHGEVTGNVTASEQVVLKGTSIHTGDITTPNIVIESGAIFNGSCIMKNAKKKMAEEEKDLGELKEERYEEPFNSSEEGEAERANF